MSSVCSSRYEALGKFGHIFTLRIFCALQTSRMLHISMNMCWRMNQLLSVTDSKEKIYLIWWSATLLHSKLSFVSLKDQKEDEKRKRREEKARLARQAAIEELQKKREEKRNENQRKAEEELVLEVIFYCNWVQLEIFVWHSSRVSAMLEDLMLSRVALICHSLSLRVPAAKLCKAEANLTN